MIYRKTSNVRRTLVGNKIVDHSDVVGASPVGAPATYIRDLTVVLIQMMAGNETDDKSSPEPTKYPEVHCMN